MTGSNVAGMTGSNVAGMTGSNVAGMTGSNAAGMTGSNEAGMAGRRNTARGMTGSNVLSSGRSSSRFGSGFSFAAMGPLDAVSVKGKTAQLLVAGHAFYVSRDEATALSVGDYVIAGAASSSSLAIVYHVGASYVAGVSTVRVKAPVDSVDLRSGTLLVGSLTVDYTPQLAIQPTLSPFPGDIVEISGVQPLPSGAMIVSSAGGGLRVAPPAIVTARIARQ
jgi:hypothetical protein